MNKKQILFLLAALAVCALVVKMIGSMNSMEFRLDGETQTLYRVEPGEPNKVIQAFTRTRDAGEDDSLMGTWTWMVATPDVPSSLISSEIVEFLADGQLLWTKEKRARNSGEGDAEYDIERTTNSGRWVQSGSIIEVSF